MTNSIPITKATTKKGYRIIREIEIDRYFSWKHLQETIKTIDKPQNKEIFKCLKEELRISESMDKQLKDTENATQKYGHPVVLNKNTIILRLLLEDLQNDYDEDNSTTIAGRLQSGYIIGDFQNTIRHSLPNLITDGKSQTEDSISSNAKAVLATALLMIVAKTGGQDLKGCGYFYKYKNNNPDSKDTDANNDSVFYTEDGCFLLGNFQFGGARDTIPGYDSPSFVMTAIGMNPNGEWSGTLRKYLSSHYTILDQKAQCDEGDIMMNAGYAGIVFFTDNNGNIVLMEFNRNLEDDKKFEGCGLRTIHTSDANHCNREFYRWEGNQLDEPTTGKDIDRNLNITDLIQHMGATTLSSDEC